MFEDVNGGEKEIGFGGGEVVVECYDGGVCVL